MRRRTNLNNLGLQGKLSNCEDLADLNYYVSKEEELHLSVRAVSA